MTKAEKTEALAHPAQPEPVAAPAVQSPAAENDNNIPLMSMIFGFVGLVTLMLFLSIPALVLGIIGYRKYSINRGFSIAGIVTGILGIIGMILFFILLMWVFASGAMYNDDGFYNDSSYDQRYENNRQFDRNREGA